MNSILRTVCVAVVLFGMLPGAATYATTISAPVNEYLLIARRSINGPTNIDVDNFELGANRAPVPSTTNFLNNNGGPTLLGAVPNLPANARDVFQGVGGNGNIALTGTDAIINLQDIGVHANPDIGIQLAAPNDSFNSSSNSFFNSGGRFPAPNAPNQFPNTFDPLTQMGVDVNPNDADQNTRIDPTGSGNPSANVGVSFGVDHSALDSELANFRTAISGLAATNILDVSGGNGGELDSSSTITGAGGASIAFGPNNSIGGVTATITTVSGLNIIDLDTGGNDFLINNANLVIDGPEDAFVIIRTSGNENVNVSNSNILSGENIGLNNILIYTDQDENDTHFNVNNAILNGFSFWSLGSSDIATININNSQGSVQLVAEEITLSDVRFTRWAFGVGVTPGPNPVLIFVPEPASMLLGIMALTSLAITRRR